MRSGHFHELVGEAEAIRIREPLAGFLGALTDEDAVLEYTYEDAVKLTGHSCPTVTAAFMCCLQALNDLYPAGEIPARGELEVTVYGRPDEAGYGVIGQVITLVTGAAAESGFKGLGGRFKRQGLLKFSSEKPDAGAVSVRFSRTDGGGAAIVRFMPWAIPFPEEKAARMGELMPSVVSGEASGEEKEEFKRLWMEKIRLMLIERKDLASWLQVERA